MEENLNQTFGKKGQPLILRTSVNSRAEESKNQKSSDIYECSPTNRTNQRKDENSDFVQEITPTADLTLTNSGYVPDQIVKKKSNRYKKLKSQFDIPKSSTQPLQNESATVIAESSIQTDFIKYID